MVGYYGLFTATVGYAIFFTGLDFYTYQTREIIRFPHSQRGRLLKAQAVLSGGLYVLVIPVALLLLGRTNMPDSLIWWLAPILVLEHFNQEMTRLFIALSKQITSSFLLFMRQGSWAIVVVLLMVWIPEGRNLDAVFLFWTISGIIAAALGLWKLWQLGYGGWRMPLDWQWVRRGIVTSLGFLVATIALRGIYTFDRYWLESLGGAEIVGVYVLFIGVARSLLTFLDAGVFAFTYPDLIRYNRDNDTGSARKRTHIAFCQTLGVTAAFAVVSWLALPYLLDWVDSPVYQTHIGLYPWILSAMMMSAVGMIPHYALYARNFDRPIIASHIAAFVAFIVAAWTLSHFWDVLAIPIALNVAFGLILIWKSLAYLYLIAPGKEGRVERSPPITSQDGTKT